MPTVNSLSALYAALQAKINIALENEVKSEVSKIMVEQIQETVYDTYSPNTNAEDYYHRRSNEDALGDPSNIGGIVINDVLEVYNAAVTNPDIYVHGELYQSQNEGDYLAPIIEYGQGYDFNSKNGDLGYEQPRPFIENSRETLRQTKVHVKALKKGLRESGIKVE